MTNAKAIEILKRLQDPEPWEPQLNSIAYDALNMAISALEKQDGKKPITVETNIYDTEEIHNGCTVQILRNSVTGDVSVGWWEEKEEK
jgi:hypothetical protein